MSEATLETSQRPFRWRALAISVGLFVVYLVLLQTFTRLGAPLLWPFTPPAGAPPLWWRVDKTVVLVGGADLIAAIVPVFLYMRLTGRRLVDLGYDRPGTAEYYRFVTCPRIGRGAAFTGRHASPFIPG